MLDHGTRVVEIFLHIAEDEQLRRFEERLRNPIRLAEMLGKPAAYGRGAGAAAS